METKSSGNLEKANGAGQMHEPTDAADTGWQAKISNAFYSMVSTLRSTRKPWQKSQCPDVSSQPRVPSNLYPRGKVKTNNEVSQSWRYRKDRKDKRHRKDRSKIHSDPLYYNLIEDYQYGFSADPMYDTNDRYRYGYASTQQRWMTGEDEMIFRELLTGDVIFTFEGLQESIIPMQVYDTFHVIYCCMPEGSGLQLSNQRQTAVDLLAFWHGSQIKLSFSLAEHYFKDLWLTLIQLWKNTPYCRVTISIFAGSAGWGLSWHTTNSDCEYGGQLSTIFVPRLNEVEEGEYLNYPLSVRLLLRKSILHILSNQNHLRDGGHLELRIRIFYKWCSWQQEAFCGIWLSVCQSMLQWPWRTARGVKLYISRQRISLDFLFHP